MDYSQADWIKMKANLIFVSIIFLNEIVHGQIPPAGISGALPVEEITESNATLPIAPRRSSQTKTIKSRIRSEARGRRRKSRSRKTLRNIGTL